MSTLMVTTFFSVTSRTQKTSRMEFLWKRDPELSPLEALDGVDLSEEFHQRPHTMRSVPFTTRGACRGAMQGALDEIIEPTQRGEGGKRMEVVLFHSWVVAFQAKARRVVSAEDELENRLRPCIRMVVVLRQKEQKVL